MNTETLQKDSKTQEHEDDGDTNGNWYTSSNP